MILRRLCGRQGRGKFGEDDTVIHSFQHVLDGRVVVTRERHTHVLQRETISLR